MGSLTDVAASLYGTGGAREREAEQMKIRANAMRPEYAKITQAADDQAKIAAQRPTLPVLGEPPSRGLRDFLATSENESPLTSVSKLVQALSLFAGATVGTTRHNAMGAMAAFAGALKGWQAGDAERADRSFKDWEAQTGKALKQYDLERTAYNDALTAGGLTLDARMRQAQIKALEYGDTQAVLAFERGGLEGALTFLTGREDAASKVRVEMQKLLEQRAEAARKAASDAETARHNRATERGAADKLAAEHAADAAHQLDPKAIELAAQTYVQTGALPSMGMGKAATGTKVAIMKRAAEIAEDMGGVEGQAARNALYKANSAELVKLQSQRGPVMAFEKTARQNLALAKELSDKVDRSGTPVYNRWNLAGRKSVQGDPDVAAFDAAVRVAINEVAKVTSGSTGGAVTSDSARHEIESMLNTAMTKPQFDSVIAVLGRDMDSRIKGFEEQIRETTEALKPKKKARETLSRKDARYIALRGRGMTDAAITSTYGVDLD